MTEAQIQTKIVKYIKTNYPGALFQSNARDNVNLSVAARKNAKAAGFQRGWPDLMIYEPSHPFVGLALELKTESARIYKLDGEPASKHIREQRDKLIELKQRKWNADFALGFEDAVAKIDEYMNRGLNGPR